MFERSDEVDSGHALQAEDAAPIKAHWFIFVQKQAPIISAKPQLTLTSTPTQPWPKP